MKKLVVASKNKNKVIEIQNMLVRDDIKVLSMNDLSLSVPDIVEDGTTFKENALIKARSIAALCKEMTIADDSGLCVDALEGEPGIFSARFAGDQKNDADNRTKVLALMNEIPPKKRQAQFRCAMAICLPNKDIAVVEGCCSGFITEKERGEDGFGYDSIFFYPLYNKTFAEISLEEKNKVSHRAKALLMVKEVIANFLKKERKNTC